MNFAALEEAIRTWSLFEREHLVRQADGGVGWVISPSRSSGVTARSLSGSAPPAMSPSEGEE
jgi:hypothetical protein